MPRKPRMFVPGIPVHVVQRGNNRQATFFDEQDYLIYLEALAQGLKRYRADLHAYVLMTNHVHLLITPEKVDSIPRIFQHVGRLYVLYINKKYKRSGTLWEGRYKCSLVNADEYLLTCYRYIEMNPVTANMVGKPEEYPWSSYRYNGLGQENSLVIPHDLYLRLGGDQASRCYAYRELFRFELIEKDIHEIRESLNYNYPLGNDRFKDEVEYYLGRSIGKRRAGRPKKQKINSA